MKNVRFEIIGKIPSKKNLYHIGRGRFYPDKAVNEYTNNAYLQIKKQLGSWKVIKEPVALDICFLMDDRGDIDNKLSTWFDLLQEIKIIENDRQIRRVNMRREKVRPSESRTSINLVVIET